MDYILIALISLLFVGMLCGFLLERKDWNKGKCPNCNLEWQHFDNDSQGGRGYTCSGCDKTIWISYPKIDN